MITSLALLAGGLATRLYPVTQKIPKSMIDINGKPFISHQLGLLKKNGIEEVVICSGYLGEQIKDYVKNGEAWDIFVKYSFDGEKLLGTGGALKKALPMLKDVFFVMYGDSYLPVNFREIADFYSGKNIKALMTVVHNEDKWDKSNVEFVNDRIAVYDKKNKTPEMKYIDYGLGIITKECFHGIKENEVVDLADIYKKLVKEEELLGYDVKKRFYEIGSFSGIEETKEFLKKE
jgi:N-acetyl-alpha-D-muramate 1-phosphate uridylyltransferase